MVIDDDHDVRESMADLLEHAGYAVAREASGEQGLDRLRAGYRPAVVLVNYQMPGMTGAEFISACRGDPRLADIPVVVLSGFAGEILSETESHLFESITKPVDLPDLLAVVQRLSRGGGRD